MRPTEGDLSSEKQPLTANLTSFLPGSVELMEQRLSTDDTSPPRPIRSIKIEGSPSMNEKHDSDTEMVEKEKPSAEKMPKGSNPAAKDSPLLGNAPRSESRRKFLGGVSGIAAAAATVGAIGLEPIFGGKESVAEASVVPYNSETREDASLNYRTTTANAEHIAGGVQPDKGATPTYTDL